MTRIAFAMPTWLKNKASTFLTYLLLGWLGSLLSACAVLSVPELPTGSSLAQVKARWGQPSGEFIKPDGTQLEYATGPQGKTTWMLHFDRQGKLLHQEQVLTEASFAKVTPGMKEQELRELLGRPSETRQLTFRPITLWAYRFVAQDCRWFVVSLQADGTVKDSGFPADPECEVLGDLVPN